MVKTPPTTPPPHAHKSARVPPNIKEVRARHVRIERLQALAERALQAVTSERAQRPAPFRRLTFGSDVDTSNLP